MDMHTLNVDQDHADKRLDIFLTTCFPGGLSRSFIKNLIDEKFVTVNGKSAKPHYIVRLDDIIEVKVDFQTQADIRPENIPLDIFYEDEDCIVVNKAIGMTVHPAAGCYSGTLVNALLYHYQELSSVNDRFRPGIVHRLDKETSGLIIVAKNNRTHVRLARQFERRVIKKRYVALVENLIEFDEGIIDAPLGRHPQYREKRSVWSFGAKEAKTIYKVLRRFENKTLVSLMPKTGRTHQLRVHMAHLGHPILGDGKYGKKQSFSRLALHAQGIGFKHPKTSTWLEFWSVIPSDFLKA